MFVLSFMYMFHDKLNIAFKSWQKGFLPTMVTFMASEIKKKYEEKVYTDKTITKIGSARFK